MWGGADSQEVGSEAATLERVRNSSLVECPRADNGRGLRPRTEAVDLRSDGYRVLSAESPPASSGGPGGGLGAQYWVLGTSGVVGERSAAMKAGPGGPLERAEARMPV